MSTALLFKDTPASAQPVALVFGASSSGVAPDAGLSLSGTLPALAGHIALARVFGLSLSAALPSLSGTVNTLYLSDTQRPTVARLIAVAQIAQPQISGIAQPEQHASRTNTGYAQAFEQASPTRAYIHGAYSDASRTPAPAQALFADATRYASQRVQALMAEADHHHLRRAGHFDDAARARTALGAKFEDGLHDRRKTVQSPFQEAARRTLRYRGTAGPALPTQCARHSRFQEAWVPRPGRYVPPVIPPVQPEYWGAALLFACPPLAYPALVFGPTQCGVPVTPGALYYILLARVYMTAHTITAARLPDLVDVPIFEASVSADSGSYCWSLQASGPASLFELLAPSAGLPAQLKLTLDGIPFVFAIDRISRSQSFGKTGVSVQGRSVTALIAAPYLRAITRNNTLARTAHQLAEDALIATGVAIDWGVGSGALANAGLVDWLVPAGAFSNSGSALDAVQSIVQAAGGYLQSHRSLPTLQARHPYGMRAGDNPGAPWGWAAGAADIELAPDAIITSAIERQDGPDINAVYVSGTSHGVLALVKRTGSAADKLAAMVTDSLITRADAARQRGLAILGTAGNKYAVRLDLPVLTGPSQPGVIDVGALVQVNASVPWRGRVRAVSVNAQRPSLRQTITLERHLETT